MKKHLIKFAKEFSKEIIENNAAIFAGAGLSVPVGYVNWIELLRPLAEELDIDINRENDLVSLAQYYKNEKNSRYELNRRIINEFSDDKEGTENHRILARLPIGTYWTTNYDSLIEDTLKKSGKIVDKKYTIEHLAETKPKRDAVVYKMHGDKEHPAKAILLKEDYEVYSTEYEPFITALKGDLISKTFLFIGFSFTDPNLDYILSRVRISHNENQRTHYAFIKAVKSKDYENKADFEYYSRKQTLFLNDLKRYTIQALIIEEYSEITEVLKMIEKTINFNNIFISGSAYSYKPFDDNDAKLFIENLSKKLIASGNKIVSGFGLGVGSYVITGALEEIYMKQKRINDNQLILKPFPQDTSKNDDFKQEVWKLYREDMISQTGIAIFIFGNKLKDSNLVEADGVYSEFEIANKNNNIIVPVGITGSVAEKIWCEVNENFDVFYPNATSNLKYLFENLNSTKEYEVLIDDIINFINEAKKNYEI